MNVIDYIEKSEDPWSLKSIGKNPKIVKMLEKEIGKKGDILDIGGGFGFYADVLRELGNNAFVLDNSGKMVREGREMFPLVKFKKGVAEKIPFPENSFDAVLCMGTLMYIENKERAFQEVKRVLKKGGIFLLYERNRSDPINTIVNLFKPTEQKIDSRDMFLTKSEIRSLAEKNGFKVNKIKGTGKGIIRQIRKDRKKRCGY